MAVVRGPSVGRGGLRCLFVRFEMCFFKYCMVVIKVHMVVCQILGCLYMGFILVL